MLRSVAKQRPGLKNWELTIGGTVAPILSRDVQRVSYPESPELGTKRYAAVYSLAFEAGLQERLSYRVNQKMSVTLASCTTVQPGKVLTRWNTYGFDPDFRCAVMPGVGYRL